VYRTRLLGDTFSSAGVHVSHRGSRRRIHRSAIVNVEAIAEIRSLFHGDYDVLLRDGTALPVGRTYRDRLLGRLGDARS
jgi:hypothetical protein